MNAPLGVPFPGEDLWTDVADPNDDESQLQPNWVGHLISKYFPGQKFIPDTFDKINVSRDYSRQWQLHLKKNFWA